MKCRIGDGFQELIAAVLIIITVLVGFFSLIYSIGWLSLNVFEFAFVVTGPKLIVSVTDYYLTAGAMILFMMALTSVPIVILYALIKDFKGVMYSVKTFFIECE
jgi:hypothetical protein